MHIERRAAKVLLVNIGIKPNEDRHQRIADSTVVTPRPSSVSDMEEQPKAGELDQEAK